MGLLSTALSLGGAAIGGAVGGPMGAKIGAALGGAAGGALSSSSGSKKATKYQLEALKEARGAIDQGYTDVQGYQKPYLDLGSSSTNALTSRLGLQQPATVAPTSNALTGGQLPMGQTGDSGQAIWGTGAPGSSDAFPTAAAPQSQPQPGTTMNSLTGAPAGNSPIAPQAPPQAPAAPAAPGVDPGTYGTTDNPTAPGAFSYGEADYKESPALKAALARMTDTVQSSAAAQGSLFSGATLKEIGDRGYDLALGDFNQERQFNYGLNRDQRADYQDDRGYLTGRFDTQTNNLFRGTGVGQTAANVTSGTATQRGNQIAGLVTEGGQVQAQNALTQGQIGSELATGVGGIIAGAIPGAGVSRAAAQPQNYTSDLGSVNYGNSLRMTSPYRF